jgi:hypothetical protein
MQMSRRRIARLPGVNDDDSATGATEKKGGSESGWPASHNDCVVEDTL